MAKQPTGFPFSPPRELQYRAVYRPGHPAVGTRLNNLAGILQNLGQAEAARRLQERALAISEAVYGPDDPEVATYLNNLAAILLELGQPEAARPLQERALAISEAVYGPGHPAVAIRLSNVAMILRELATAGAWSSRSPCGGGGQLGPMQSTNSTSSRPGSVDCLPQLIRQGLPEPPSA